MSYKLRYINISLENHNKNMNDDGFATHKMNKQMWISCIDIYAMYNMKLSLKLNR